MSSTDERHGTVGTVFRNRNLRLLEIAWAGSVMAVDGTDRPNRLAIREKIAYTSRYTELPKRLGDPERSGA